MGTELKQFLDESVELVNLMTETSIQIHKALSGNNSAARRARKYLIEISKKGRTFRKNSIQCMEKKKKVDASDIQLELPCCENGLKGGMT